MAAKKVKVAVIQMVSSPRVEENCLLAEKLLHQASKEGAQWAVLPEYWPLIGKQEQDKVSIGEDEGEGPLQNRLKEWAKKFNLTLFAGSISLRSPEKGKIYNSLLTFSPQGTLKGRYDKIHLFNYRGERESYLESTTIMPGQGFGPKRLEVDSWQVIEALCFDVRFADFFFNAHPFEVLVLPAAFTYETGQAHWEILVRSRAIENQVYVLAAAQGGTHDNDRRTYGRSMIVDPWGAVLAQAKEGNDVVYATLDPDYLKAIRQKLPIFPL